MDGVIWNAPVLSHVIWNSARNSLSSVRLTGIPFSFLFSFSRVSRATCVPVAHLPVFFLTGMRTTRCSAYVCQLLGERDVVRFCGCVFICFLHGSRAHAPVMKWLNNISVFCDGWHSWVTAMERRADREEPNNWRTARMTMTMRSAKGIGATATGHHRPARPKEMVSGYRWRRHHRRLPTRRPAHCHRLQRQRRSYRLSDRPAAGSVPVRRSRLQEQSLRRIRRATSTSMETTWPKSELTPSSWRPNHRVVRDGSRGRMRPPSLQWMTLTRKRKKRTAIRVNC